MNAIKSDDEDCGNKTKEPQIGSSNLENTSDDDKTNVINTEPVFQFSYDTRPFVQIFIAGSKFKALLDTGATKSYINKKVARYLDNQNIKSTPVKTRTILANGSTSMLQYQYAFPFQVNDDILKHQFMKLEGMHEDVLFGIDLLKRLGYSLTRNSEICNSISLTNNRDIPDTVIQDIHLLFQDTIPEELLNSLTDRTELTESQENRLTLLLHEFLPKFENLPNTSHITEHVIKMKHQKPLKQRYYPRNPFMKSIINEQIDQLITNDQIEKSESPYSSPLVLVKKKDNSWRMCVD